MGAEVGKVESRAKTHYTTLLIEHFSGSLVRYEAVAARGTSHYKLRLMIYILVCVVRSWTAVHVHVPK